MFGAFERTVAFRYLRARRQEGFISVIAWFSLLGIALGVATLITVMSVQNGLVRVTLSKLLGLEGHIGVAPLIGPLEDYDALAERLRALDGVNLAMPMVEGQAMARSSPRLAAFAGVRGVRPADLAVRPVLRDGVDAQTLAAFGPDSVIVGYDLARRLGVMAGDQVTLITPDTTSTAVGPMPRMKTYTLAGVFNVGMFNYDSGLIYMTLSDAQKLFRTGDGVTAIELMLADPNKLAAARAEVIGALDRQMRITDWESASATWVNALHVQRNVMFLITALIILVAAFNIISSLIMLVKDKGRAIAILRTMGASRGMILRIFLLAGSSIGFIGTISGLILGLAFTDNIDAIMDWLESLTGVELFSAEVYGLPRLPADMDANEIVQIVLTALGLSFAATIYPSWRAARLDPVEALRNE